MKSYIIALSRPINKFTMRTTFRYLVKNSHDTPLQVAARFRRIMYQDNGIPRWKLLIYKTGGSYVVARTVLDVELNDVWLGDINEYRKHIQWEHGKFKKLKKRLVYVKEDK